MKREPAPQEYTCWDCPDRYCHALPVPQKLKGLIMHFGESIKIGVEISTPIFSICCSNAY